MTNRDAAAKALLEAVEQVLSVGDDGGSMEWVDWSLLRSAKAKAIKAGIDVRRTP